MHGQGRGGGGGGQGSIKIVFFKTARVALGQKAIMLFHIALVSDDGGKYANFIPIVQKSEVAKLSCMVIPSLYLCEQCFFINNVQDQEGLH